MGRKSHSTIAGSNTGNRWFIHLSGKRGNELCQQQRADRSYFVYVLKDDEAKTIADAKDYIFGYHEILDRENTDKYVQSINTSLNKTITSKDL